MVDIAMCTGDGCPIRETCYRFKAVPEPENQTYMPPPFKDGACSFFWSLDGPIDDMRP